MPRNDDDDSVHPPPPPPKKLDSSSPYYIGPYERPGDFITTARLNLNNYTDWVHDMTMALESRRKFGFVNGTYIRPQPPCSAEDWRVLQSTLYSWIINTIEKDVKSILPRFNNAKDLWDALKNKFSHSDGPQLHQIMMDLSTCRQAEGTSMSNYYSRLTQLWTELDVHEPLVGCSADCNCGRVCSAIEIYASRRASSRLHQFLLGVLPAFSSLRSVILSQNPLPDVDRVFQMFCTEERLHCITSAVPVVPDLSALNVRGFPRQLSRGGLSRLERMKLYCTYCHKNGHERSSCFELSGEYPEWYFEKNKSILPEGGDRGGSSLQGRLRGSPVDHSGRGGSAIHSSRGGSANHSGKGGPVIHSGRGGVSSRHSKISAAHTSLLSSPGLEDESSDWAG